MGRALDQLKKHLGSEKSKDLTVFYVDICQRDLSELFNLVSSFKYEVSKTYRKNKSGHMKKNYDVMQHSAFRANVGDYSDIYYKLFISLKSRKTFSLLQSWYKERYNTVLPNKTSKQRTLLESKFGEKQAKKMMGMYRGMITTHAEGAPVLLNDLEWFITDICTANDLKITPILRDCFLREYHKNRKRRLEKIGIELDYSDVA